MVQTVTKDLIFDAILSSVGKSEDYRKAWISGLASGINVQVAILKADNSATYDGYIASVLRANALQEFETMRSGLGVELFGVITKDLFVNYDILTTVNSSIYLIAFGTGQIEVSRKYYVLLNSGVIASESVEYLNLWAETTCNSLLKMY